MGEAIVDSRDQSMAGKAAEDPVAWGTTSCGGRTPCSASKHDSSGSMGWRHEGLTSRGGFPTCKPRYLTVLS